MKQGQKYGPKVGITGGPPILPSEMHPAKKKHSGTRPERRVYCIQELDHCSGPSTDSDTHQVTLHSAKLTCRMQGKHGKVQKTAL